MSVQSIFCLRSWHVVSRTCQVCEPWPALLCSRPGRDRWETRVCPSKAPFRPSHGQHSGGQCRPSKRDTRDSGTARPRPTAAESCRRPAEDGTLRLLGLLDLLRPGKKESWAEQEVIIRACLNVWSSEERLRKWIGTSNIGSVAHRNRCVWSPHIGYAVKAFMFWSVILHSLLVMWEASVLLINVRYKEPFLTDTWPCCESNQQIQFRSLQVTSSWTGQIIIILVFYLWQI